jgi:Flp pilus assembly protein TadG
MYPSNLALSSRFHGWRRASSGRGQASLEMLIVLLMLIPLIFGGIELSRAVAVHSALDSGTAVATRMLALNPDQAGDAYIVLTTTINTNIMGTSGLGSVTLTPDIALNTVSFGSVFCMTGAAEFTPAIPFLSLAPIHMTSKHCAVMERMS